MPLDTGIYIISTMADNRPVGRHLVEDRSLLPKAVRALPNGIQAPRIVVEQTPKGNLIKAGGAPTGKFRDAVYAFLIDVEQPQHWVITAQPHHGENVYIVETEDRTAGWVVASEDTGFGPQVEVKPLKSTKSLPPQYSPNELFEFVRIDRDD